MSGQVREPLAIVGIGCRLPGGANDPDSFWNLLRKGKSAIREVPSDRWNVDRYYSPDPQVPGKMITRWGGFIDDIDKFDAQFFGISPREALRMDPQQRWLLEVAWEALEDAGLPPDRMSGTATGVFVGISSNDYANIQMKGPADVDVHTNSGSTLSIASNRISYLLNLRGPSISVDTACSSALVAVNLACQSIWDGQCVAALAGGVNALLTPDSSIGFSKASMLSPSGQCFAFDARANGYVRGEGAGVMVLKPLARALEDNDPVYAVIRAAVVNQDGRTNAMTVPGLDSQSEMLEEAYRQAGIPASRVNYMEAHGTGTPVGDPIEVQALGNVLCRDRAEGQECVIGSVKTNIGHLESASGIAGLIKAALVLHNRQIPPNLNYETPNPNIPLKKLRLRVPVELEDLPNGGTPAIVAVNSFGFGGTNAHIVLEEAPAECVRHEGSGKPSTGGPHIVPISAQTPEALKEYSKAYRKQIINRTERALALQDFAATAGLRKNHHECRLAVVGTSAKEISDRLRAWEDGAESANGLVSGRASAEVRDVVFVFSGQGPQWWGMGRELFEKEPVYRAALEKIDALLQPLAGWSLLEEMSRSEEESRINRTDIAQPAIFALQVGLAELLRSRGVEAVRIIGHSVGEVAAAYWAGIYTLEDAVKIIYHRSRLQNATGGKGRMVAVGVSREKAKELISGHEEAITVAVINSPSLVTLAGDTEVLESIVAKLEEDQVFVRWLLIDYAFHTHQMDPIKGELLEALADIDPHPGNIPYISTVTADVFDGKRLDAAYWWRNVRDSVLFSTAITKMVDRGDRIFVELGPHPILCGAINECAAGVGEKTSAIASLMRKEPEQEKFCEALATLYCAGYPLDWSRATAGEGRFVRLPAYPWKNERFWLESEESSDYRLAPYTHPLLGMRVNGPNPTWENEIDPRAFGYLRDHQFWDSMIFPAAGYAEIGIAVARELYPKEPYVVEDLQTTKALFFSEQNVPRLRVVFDESDGSVKVYSSFGAGKSWELNAHSRLQKLSRKEGAPEALGPIRDSLDEKVSHEKYYSDYDDAGYQFGPTFRQLRAVWRSDGESLGEIVVPDEVRETLADYHFHPAVLDACFQCLKGGQVFPDERSASENFFLPASIKRIRMYRALSDRLWGHVKISRDDGEVVETDIDVFNEHGERVADITCFRVERVVQNERAQENDLDQCFYQYKWQRLHLLGSRVSGSANLENPQVLTAGVGEDIREVHATYDYEDYYHKFAPRFEATALSFLLQALIELGWEPNIGDEIEFEDFLSRFNIIEDHRRLSWSLFRELEAKGYLQLLPVGTWRVMREFDPQDPEPELEALTEEYPQFDSEIPLQRICGSHLAEVLTGDTDPLELIFPGGSDEMFAKFYTEGADFEAYNELIKKVVAKAIRRLPEDRPIRVLEIGAGTGSLTKSILPVLPAERAEFCFTDIGPAFLIEARKMFSDHPFVDYRTLDIEKDPVEQGFRAHSYDLVLATNVLHITGDLAHTLKNIQLLLDDAGMLMFLEVTRPRLALDLVFGLLPGWWGYTDTDLRKESGLMSRPAWEKLLVDTEFTDVASFVNMTDEDSASQTVFLANRPAIEAVASDTPGVAEADGADPEFYLVLNDEGGTGSALAGKLEESGRSCVVASVGSEYAQEDDSHFLFRRGCKEDLQKLFGVLADRESQLRGVIHTRCVDNPDTEAMTIDGLEDAQNAGVLSLLELIHVLEEVEIKPTPRVWAITKSAQSVVPGEGIGSIASAPVYGFLRVANNEHLDYRWTGIDICADDPQGEAAVNQLFDEITLGPDSEFEIAFRGGNRYVNRLVNVTTEELPVRNREAVTEDGVLPYRLEISTTGILDNLSLNETARRPPEVGEIEVQVAAGGLNFRDVMKALGMYPGDSVDLKWLGDDFSGTVVRVGEGVEGVEVGDEVVGMAPYCFRSFVTVHHHLVFPKPNHITFEEAATLPTVYLTGHYALNHLANLQPGERVLIHSGTGGVGQAAIRIAQRVGAEIFSTAGSPEKRAFLRDMGVPHVMDSRTLDFADEVMEITEGKGVDVVLNSQKGDFIPKSLSVLARYGRFLEIGKVDIYQNTKVGLEPFKNNISYSAIDLAQHLEDRPEFISQLLRELSDAFAAKELNPLPLKVFPITDAVEAFRYMAQASHIGKNVISFREASIPVGPSSESDTLFVKDGAYLITGGFSGFGLEVAKWMAAYGARNIVLMGRSGAHTDEERQDIDTLRAGGINVTEALGDVTREEDVRRTFALVADELPPLKGIIHGAMYLDDDFLVDLDQDRFLNVLRPKMVGAWHLHKCSLDLDLDHFICFSSISSMIGASRQSNYCAGNYFLDALAHHRQAQGLPALTMNWGALSGAGFVERNKVTQQYLEALGLKTITIEEALSIFARALTRNPIQLGVSRIDWAAVSKINQTTSVSQAFSLLAHNKDSKKGSRGSGSIRPQILSASPEMRMKLVEDFIADQVGEVFGTSAAKIDRSTPLTQIGLDSLMAIELMNRIESNMGISLPMGEFLQGPNISELAVPVLELLVQTAGAEGDVVGEFDETAVAPGSLIKASEEELEFPLSYGQHALWYLNRLAPDSSAYNLIFSSKISPYVDIPIMEKAFAALFRRHPMLDVTFRTAPEGPVQTIRTSGTIDFREHDASHLNDEEIKELLVEHAHKPFDLENGPVIRLELFRTSDNAHVTLLSMHHIISDAFSVVLLLNDLIESYFSIRAGAEPKFKELEYRYSDYVRWQRKLLASAASEKMRSYWVDQLEDAPLFLDLPTDHARPPVQTFNGGTHGFQLDTGLTEKIGGLSGERNVTLYHTLLSAFQVLLHRYCNQDDLIVGSPCAGRNQLELQDMVGYFINPVPLRSRVDDDPSFLDYLDRVKGSVIGAQENQDYPLSKLVDDLKVKREPSRSSIFQVTFSMERIPGFDEQGIAVFLIGQGGHNFEVGDISVESIDLNLRQAQFEITLVVEEAGGNIYGCWQYNRDLFEPETIEHLNALYRQVLADLVEHPHKRISEISLLSQEEERKILEDWNATAEERPEDTCLHELIAEHGARIPNRPAVMCAGKTLTYRELDWRANGVARKLREQGVGVDVPVGLLVDRTVDMLVGALGILKSGGCYVPLDPAFPRYRLEQMLEDARPPVVVTQRKMRNLVPKGPWTTLLVEDCRSVNRITAIQNQAPDSLAYIIYTSGSTGRPKGVEISHRAVVNFLISMRHTPGLSADDTLLAVTTLSFDISILELFLPLISDASVVIATRDETIDGRRLNLLMNEYAITTMQATPATWQMLLSSGWNGKYDLRVFCGGETLSRELADSLLPCTRAVWNLYGPTETTIWSTVDKVSSQEGAVSIGRPIANTTIYILDDNNKPLPPGFTGNLYIGGEGLARGYFRQPELTAEKFVTLTFPNGRRERVYQTGDLARFRSDGKVEFLGRSDSQIKLRGFRIELGEIESQLRTHPKVKEVVVIKRDDIAGGENLAAYLIAEHPDEDLVSELRTYLAGRLPEYMRPAAYKMLDEYPLTPNNKIDRKALPAPTLERTGMETDYVPPQTPSERILVDILSAAFKSESIGIGDNFFELGGDSLLAVQVLTEISQVFNRHLPVEVFLQNPTVENLANYLDFTPDRSAAEAIEINGNGRLSGAGAGNLADTEYLTIQIADGDNGSPDDLPQVDSVAMAYIPDAFVPLTGLTREEIVRSWFHHRPIISNLYETPFGRIGLVMLPRLGAELYKDHDALGEQVIDALELASKIGARRVSLTGLIPSATDYGRQITEWMKLRDDLPEITTGHATTTATIVKSMESLLSQTERDFSEEVVAVLGLGSIGYATLRLMLEVLPAPAELILCDLYQKGEALEEIRRKLFEELGFRGKVRIETTRGQLPEAVYAATFILGATNVPGILDVKRLLPGTMIVDDSFPPCFRVFDAIERIETRRDILFTTGGLLRLTQEVKETIYLPDGTADLIDEVGGNQLMALAGRDPFEVTGCILSSLITGKEEDIRSTLGPVKVVDSLAHYHLLESLELSAGKPQCENYFISTETIADFKKVTESGKARRDALQGV